MWLRKLKCTKIYSHQAKDPWEQMCQSVHCLGDLPWSRHKNWCFSLNLKIKKDQCSSTCRQARVPFPPPLFILLKSSTD
jgi:hypothetical protein